MRNKQLEMAMKRTRRNMATYVTAESDKDYVDPYDVGLVAEKAVVCAIIIIIAIVAWAV